MVRRYTPLLFALLIGISLQGQSSQGNTFWLAYMENLNLQFNDDPIFTLVLQSENTTDGVVEVPATGLAIPFSINAGDIVELELPPALWYLEGSDVLGDKGIRIQADLPIRAAAFHYRAYFSESTHLLPASALGTVYLVSCYKDDVGNDPTSFVIVSTADNTEVEITPSTLTDGLRPAGVPYSIVLDAGQTYQVQAEGDLSGSAVRSLNGQPIAVFSGAQQADILDCSGGADSHLFDQAIPVEHWGQLYHFVPFAGQGSDVIRILASVDNTTVFFDCGQQLVLDRGAYVTLQRATPTVISASAPIAVSQFNTSGSCSPSANGDPNMLQLFPADYRIGQCRLLSSGRFNPFINDNYFDAHFVNIVSPLSEAMSVRIDGFPIPGGFTPFPGQPGIGYAQVPVSAGPHEVSGDGLFQAYSYGFGFVDAYTTHLGYSERATLDYTCLDIEAEGLFCKDSTLQFTYSSNVNFTELAWDFDNGQMASTDTATVSYDVPGSYTITLTVEDALGNTYEESLTLQIVECGPEPCDELPLNIITEGEACSGAPTTLSFEFPGTPTSATWILGNGSTASGLNPTVTYSNPGTYTVSLSLSDALNCSYTATAEIVIANCFGCGPELVDLDFTGAACVDSTLVFPLPASIVDNAFVNLSWTVNGEVFAEQGALSISFDEAGSYLIQLEALTIDGCPYFGEFVVDIEDCGNNPCFSLPPVTIIAEQPFCIGQALTFTLDTEADLTTYEWAANNGDSGMASTFTTIYTEQGVATIFLMAFDADGCAYEAVIEADLEFCGDPCTDLPPLSIVAEGDRCQDSLLTFSLDTEANLLNYSWSFGDDQASNAPNPEITYTAAGLYTVTLIANDANGCIYTDTLQLIVEDCPLPDPCAEQPPLRIQADSIVCVDSVLQFQSTGPNNLLLYSWQLDDGQQSEEPEPTASYDSPGLYAAVLVAVDEEGCIYSDNFPFEVVFCEPDSGCRYVFPNTFTPNGDQTNETFGLVYNCPVNAYQLRVFNRWGEEVFSTGNPEESWDGTFRGKAAPIEVYYFSARFEQADGQTRQLQGDLTLVR